MTVQYVQYTRPGREAVFRARTFVAHYLRTGDPALAAKAVSPMAKDFAKAGRDLLESIEVKAELSYQLEKLSVQQGVPPDVVLTLIQAQAAVPYTGKDLIPPVINIVLVPGRPRV